MYFNIMDEIPSGPHEVQLGRELIRLIISSVEQRKSFHDVWEEWWT